MAPWLRSLVIVLVGAAVGAVVAGGAISYVNGSAGPAVTVTPYRSEPDSVAAANSAAENREDRSEDARPSDEPSESATVDEPRSTQDATAVRENPPLDGGPSAVVTTDASAVSPTKPAAATKPAPRVVEEDAPKVKEDGDGGSLRDGTKDGAKNGSKDGGSRDGDGGSVR